MCSCSEKPFAEGETGFTTLQPASTLTAVELKKMLSANIENEIEKERAL